METSHPIHDDGAFPVSSEEELESHQIEYSTEQLEDADAWMRGDTISEGEEDEEKDSLLPFGLNQSWPRVSHPTRRDTDPRFHKRTIHRQISQESLEESTSLLLDHVVMLPGMPHEVMLPSVPHEGAIRNEESKLSNFSCPDQENNDVKETREGICW